MLYMVTGTQIMQPAIRLALLIGSNMEHNRPRIANGVFGSPLFGGFLQ
jgi:hypothetical protein